MADPTMQAPLDPRLLKRARQLQRDTSYDSLRPLRRRRMLVVLQTVVVLALPLTAVPVGSEPARRLLLLGLAIAGVAGVVLLRGVMRGAADFPEDALDERVVASRNTAYVRAFGILAAAVSLTLVIQLLAGLWAGVSVSQDLVLSLLLASSIGTAALPSALLAWAEVDA